MEQIVEKLIQELSKQENLQDIPVGSYIIDNDNNIVGVGFNNREFENKISGHAEIEAIDDAIHKLGFKNLEDYKIISTLEPCIMCYGAIKQVKIKQIYFVVENEKFGFNSSLSINHIEETINKIFLREGDNMEIIFKRTSELKTDELLDMFKMRSQAFVVDQKSIYLDIDDYDYDTTFVIIKEVEKMIASSRLLDKGDYVTIGRVVCIDECRGRGIGRILFQASLDKLKELYPTKVIKLQAQSYLLDFYISFGFKAISENYILDGIEHIDMLKYRPIKFKDVAGHKNTVDILTKQLSDEKITHAFLFAGQRGTGKTSVARILAKSVNCKNLSQGVSCETCESCVSANNENRPEQIIAYFELSNNQGMDFDIFTLSIIEIIKEIISYNLTKQEQFLGILDKEEADRFSSVPLQKMFDIADNLSEAYKTVFLKSFNKKEEVKEFVETKNDLPKPKELEQPKPEIIVEEKQEPEVVIEKEPEPIKEIIVEIEATESMIYKKEQDLKKAFNQKIISNQDLQIKEIEIDEIINALTGRVKAKQKSFDEIKNK
ncbi:hypothetical protein FQA39_LY13029 [Lamprigera yunnana]|nr:hypothetical protein FQA39_LY13029 [Lamprigera yunnana]